MTDFEVSKLIAHEFKVKTLGTTIQYLEIHEPLYENELPKIERIDRDKNGDTIIAYLPVKDEYFSFAIYIDEKTGEILSFNTESRNLVSMIVASETMTSTELKELTKLECQEFWNKGDKRPNSRTTYKFSGIEFYLNPEPDEFEDKLQKLLNFLETDKDGILALSSKAQAYIHVLMDFHGGNQLLGGLSMDSGIIKRLNDLNLSIDFQFAAWGNGFK